MSHSVQHWPRLFRHCLKPSYTVLSPSFYPDLLVSCIYSIGIYAICPSVHTRLRLVVKSILPVSYKRRTCTLLQYIRHLLLLSTLVSNLSTFLWSGLLSNFKDMLLCCVLCVVVGGLSLLSRAWLVDSIVQTFVCLQIMVAGRLLAPTISLLH